MWIRFAFAFGFGFVFVFVFRKIYILRIDTCTGRFHFLDFSPMSLVCFYYYYYYSLNLFIRYIYIYINNKKNEK